MVSSKKNSNYNVFHDSFYQTYQKDAGNITQLYDLIHLASRDILMAHLENKNDKKEIIKILDVGPGAGKELENLLPALSSLNKKIEIDLVDFNNSVINDLKVAIESEDKRFGKISSNISFNYYGGKKNGDINNFMFEENMYDVIYSSFTIHHLTDLEKLNFYRNAYHSISKGGILLILDLMKFHHEFISSFAADQEYGFILNNLLSFDIAKIEDEKIDRDKIKGTVLKKFKTKYHNLIDWNRLFELVSDIRNKEKVKRENSYSNFYTNTFEWIRHYEEENILAPVEWQTELLSSLGFKEVCTPFIHWQNVLLMARK